MRKISDRRSLRSLLRPEKLIWPLLALLFVERLAIFWELGDFLLGGDDARYILSGLYFVKTGMISYGGPYPSAMIMPGMTVSIGAASLLLGDGPALRFGLRFCGCLMGAATAYYTYRSAALYTRWGGLLAAAWFLLPNLAWVNHTILTETPFMLFFVLCLYCTLQMGRTEERKYRIGYALSFLLGLMFRANLILMPFFTAVYLLVVGRMPLRRLLRRGLVLAGALGLFIVPWSVRNYIHFGELIPLSYGSGNPVLLGTYQGEGWPLDGELDYETNVDAAMRRDYGEYYKAAPSPHEQNPEELAYIGDLFETCYADYFDPEGKIQDREMLQFLSMKADQLKARYRLREWWKRDPVSLLKSYLIAKPLLMLNWPWSWERVLGADERLLLRFDQLDFALCLAAVALSLVLKKRRGPVLWLAAVYTGFLYFAAMGQAISRYTITIAPARYIIIALGAGLAASRLRERGRRVTV